MQTLPEHYGDLSGLDKSWRVVSVDLKIDPAEVRIYLESTGAAVCCSQCGKECPLKDHGPERQWRHLDTMQFTTTIHAKVPRTKCENCGVKTCHVPWAEPHGRYTLLFEAFAVQVLQAAATVEQARILLRLTWESVQRIMDRAVERGIQRRKIENVGHVGMDEKSFGRGHDYVSVITDIDGSRVLDVVPGHDGAAADSLWNTLTDDQNGNVDAVAMDRSGHPPMGGTGCWQPGCRTERRRRFQSGWIKSQIRGDSCAAHTRCERPVLPLAFRFGAEWVKSGSACVNLEASQQVEESLMTSRMLTS